MILKHARNWGHIIFIDHYSGFMYNYIIMSIYINEIIEARNALEQNSRLFEVKIKRYTRRGYNMKSNDKNFTWVCIKSRQNLTFYGIGAYNQT